MINEKIVALGDIIRKEYSNIVGVIVFKDSELAYEKYFNNYKRDDAIHVASVTKSLLSTLIGIAVDKGIIKSVEQNVLDFFDGYEIKRGEKTIQKITIKDLITMTVPYKFKSEPYTKVYTSNDWSKAVLDLMGGKGKIGDFKYTTIGLQVLSAILSNATNQTVLDFATENLFKHLDIKIPLNLSINNKDEYIAFLKSKHVNTWVIDPKGFNTAGWGLALSVMDMAKIGQLYLNMGKWNDKQIISSKWIENSIKEQSRWGELPYGYLWWIIDGENHRDYAAIGDGGNVIFVSPDKNMVIAIASQFMPRVKDRIELIKKKIIPLFENN